MPDPLYDWYRSAYDDPMPVEEEGSVQGPTPARGQFELPGFGDYPAGLGGAAGVNLSGPMAEGLTPPRELDTSASYRGTNLDKFGRLQGKVPYETEVALTREEEAAKAAAAKTAVSAATEEERAALKKEGSIEARIARAKSLGLLDLARINTEAARTEQQAIDSARAEADSTKADYRAALADLRASQVRPNQLFENMGAGKQFATLVSVFLAGFTGGTGVETSVMPILNNAIQRNIDAQVTNINNKARVADGFKTLWDMQSQQSASEAEARLRMHGLVLQSVKDEIEGNMARYEGGLATAKAQRAMATLNKELVNITSRLDQIADENSFRRQGFALEKRGQDLRAAAEAASLRQRKAEMEAKEGEGAAPGMFLYDTSESGQNKPRWIFHDTGLSPGEREKARKMVNAGAGIVEELRFAEQWRRKMIGEHGVAPFLGPSNPLREEATRAYLAMITNSADKLARARTGAAAPEQEMRRLMGLIPYESWITNGGVNKVHAAFLRSTIGEVNREIAQVATPVDPDDPDFATAEKVEIDAILEDRAGRKEDRVDRLIGGARDRVSGQEAKDRSFDDDWQSFATESGMKFQEVATLGRRGTGRIVKPGSEGKYPADRAPVWAANWTKLRDVVQDTQFRHERGAPPSEEEIEVAQRALQELTIHATSRSGQAGAAGEDDAYKRAYAQYLLNSLETKHNRLYGE